MSANGGTRADLGFYVRSIWEANYARYLKWLKDCGEIRHWEYEPKTFEFKTIKRGTRFYTPDFRVTEGDGRIVWHEVKGYEHQKGQTALKRMAKYYPDEEICVIDRRGYQSIARDVAKIIPHWESAR